MESAGLSTFFTTATDFAAFMIGTASPYVGIRDFCFFTAFAVGFTFILQNTMFMAFLVFQANREKYGSYWGNW